jgi:hypothetical protein
MSRTHTFLTSYVALNKDQFQHLMAIHRIMASELKLTLEFAHTIPPNFLSNETEAQESHMSWAA